MSDYSPATVEAILAAADVLEKVAATYQLDEDTLLEIIRVARRPHEKQAVNWGGLATAATLTPLLLISMLALGGAWTGRQLGNLLSTKTPSTSEVARRVMIRQLAKQREALLRDTLRDMVKRVEEHKRPKVKSPMLHLG